MVSESHAREQIQPDDASRFSREVSLGVPCFAIVYPFLVRGLEVLHFRITEHPLSALTLVSSYLFAFVVVAFCIFAFGLSFELKGREGTFARVLAVVALLLNVALVLRNGYV